LQVLIVPKPEHSTALALKEGRSANIALAFGVLTTISFDNQSRLLTNKVGNERSDRLLAPELCTLHLAVAKHGPQSSFGAVISSRSFFALASVG
jgi:hypothetical protein